jgi:UDP-glucose 4-epimerase
MPQPSHEERGMTNQTLNAHPRVLVTGGAGFIGSRLVALLTQQGVATGVIDNLSSGMPLPANIARGLVANVQDRARLIALCNAFRPTAVVHLAAVHHIPTCESLRAYSLETNIVGTEVVLEAAELCGVETVVIASSGAVYAWKDAPLVEDETPVWVSDNYSLGKLANEYQLRLWSERTGRRGRVARIFNTIGSGDPNAHLIPDVLAQLKQGSAQEIRLGNLAPRRDYIYVDDVAAGLLSLLSAADASKAFDTFNICTGAEISVEMLVRKICLLFDKDARIIPDANRVRRIDRPRLLGSNAKILAAHGWSPRLSLDDAIRRTVIP